MREEVFLITDSVNSMSTIVNYLGTGEITTEEAEARFNEINTKQEKTNIIKLDFFILSYLG